MLQRGAEERLARQEHDDELGRGVELAPVRLARQLRHVLAHLARMFDEPRGAGLVVSLNRLEIRHERRLCIHDDLLVAWQLHDQVGPEAPVAGRRGLLLEEVAVIDHPRELDDALQLQLAPVAAHVRLPQRLHEIAGLAVERGEARAERADLLVEPGRRRRAVHLDLAQFGVDLMQGLDQRLHDLGDRLLALVEIGDGARLHLAERRPGEAQHRFAVLLQCFRRERAEGFAQRLFCRLEQRVAVDGCREVALEPGLFRREGRRTGLQARDILFACAEPVGEVGGTFRGVVEARLRRGQLRRLSAAGLRHSPRAHRARQQVYGESLRLPRPRRTRTLWMTSASLFKTGPA